MPTLLVGFDAEPIIWALLTIDGVEAGVVEVLITDGAFVRAFSVAAALTLMPAVLYYTFFHSQEARRRRDDNARFALQARDGRRQAPHSSSPY